MIGNDGRLRVYDAAAACSQSLLCELEDGKFKNHWFLFNAPLADRSLVLVTHLAILVVSFHGKPNLEWRAMIHCILLLFFPLLFFFK